MHLLLLLLPPLPAPNNRARSLALSRLASLVAAFVPGALYAMIPSPATAAAAAARPFDDGLYAGYADEPSAVRVRLAVLGRVRAWLHLSKRRTGN